MEHNKFDSRKKLLEEVRDVFCHYLDIQAQASNELLDLLKKVVEEELNTDSLKKEINSNSITAISTMAKIMSLMRLITENDEVINTIIMREYKEFSKLLDFIVNQD